MASTGVVLAVLQLAFALTWVVYVVYLPALAAQAGIAKQYVPWILLMDQAIFAACDWAAGVHADRLLRAVGRIGPRLAGVTLASGAAFLALPWIAPAGSPALFVVLTALWSATSSALRAPPLVLLAKHAAAPRQPWLAGSYVFGVGLAGAVAPYFGGVLKDVDPRIPFAVSSIAVAIVTFALAGLERKLGATPSTLREHVWSLREASEASVVAFALAAGLLAAAFQFHFPVNAAPAFLKHAEPSDLQNLMPIFWIGFNVAVLPATILARRLGGTPTMGIGAAAAAAGSYFAGAAPDLDALILAQLASGGAWGLVLVSAVAAALELGRPNREGSITGLLFSMLAVAAFARIGFTAFVSPSRPELMPHLPMAPPVLWAIAALLLAGLAAGPGRHGRSAGR